MKHLRYFLFLGVLFIFSISSIFSMGNKEIQTIKFAGSGGYPPFNYITDDGIVEGFDVDVAKEISLRLGYNLEYVTTQWERIIDGLISKEYDSILGSMAITEDRLKVIDFSTPYYYSGAQLFTLDESGIRSFDDINNNTVIGVVNGTTFEEDAKELGAKLILFNDDIETIDSLLKKDVDVIITDRVVGVNAIYKLDKADRISFVGDLIRTEECGIAFNKDDKELKDRVNIILAEMRRDGTLSTLSKKWFGVNITDR